MKSEDGPFSDGLVAKLDFYRGREPYLELEADALSRSGLGAELNAHDRAGLEAQLSYTEDLPLRTCHLRDAPGGEFGYSLRGDPLAAQASARALGSLMDRYTDRVSGYVIHDEGNADRSRLTEGQKAGYAEALSAVESRSTLYLEFANLHPDDYVDVLSRVASPTVSACLDIGHLYQFAVRREGLGRDGAVARVQDVVSRVAALGKPVHLHVHDCDMSQRHPWYGVPDHLVPGEGELGLDGIRSVLEPAYAALGREGVSVNIEVLLRPGLDAPLEPAEEARLARYASERGLAYDEVAADARMVKGTYAAIAASAEDVRAIIDGLAPSA